MAFHQFARINRRAFLAGGASAFCAVSAGNRAEAASLTELLIDSRILEVKGRAAKVYGIRDQNGNHGVNQILSNKFAVRLTNRLAEETLIHWHGLTPPAALDGTPMLSGPTLKPGESRDYVFATRDAGTHWMHSHFGLQEQQLLAAPLIIRETETPLVDEQEHVVILHDFTFRDPQEILAELQGGGGAHAGHAGHDMKAMDGQNDKAPMAGMLNDVNYDAMLANDRTLDDPEIVQVERGGRLRLRIINAAAASNMWIDLGQIAGELIAVDGKTIRNVRGSRFPLAIAQRADIRLSLPQASGAWPILFKTEGSALQSGIVLRSGDSAITKIGDKGEVQPGLDLSLEASLRTLVHLPETPVSRSEIVSLTGGDTNYNWGLNGKSSMHDVLFTVREGERYEVMLHNLTAMAHPMHLHGHYFKVVGIGEKRIDGAVRDTVIVPVGETVTIQFDADNPGTWAFHCHHLYHMNAGMMGAIAYRDAA